MSQTETQKRHDLDALDFILTVVEADPERVGISAEGVVKARRALDRVRPPAGRHEEEEEEWEDNEEGGCSRCGGSGSIMICVDDMCHGAGYCLHGDGDVMCPDCLGHG